MKSPYIWIIVALLLLVIGLIVFWPSPEPDTTQAYKAQIERDRHEREELQEKLNETLAKIRTDSLRQAIQAQDYKKHTDSLKSRIGQLRANPTVITVLSENPEVKALVDQQDSLILVQRARIDTLTINLDDLRVDLSNITGRFESQLAASDRIIEAQGQIIDDQDKEIKKQRREKRAILIGGIVATVAALLVR